MAGPPAVCVNGHVFTADLFGGEGPAVIKISGVTVSCSVCGARALIVDGDYSMVEGVISAISGPEWTADRLRNLAAVMTEMSDAEPLETIDRVTEAEPELAGLFGGMSRAEKIAAAALLFDVVRFILGG